MISVISVLLACLTIVDGCRIIAFAGNQAVSGKKLLFESENNLPALAYDHPFLPALDNSKYWDSKQCGLRNAHENRDGWGVGWYPDSNNHGGFPLRFRTLESIVSLDNSTSPEFIDLLEGRHEISVMNKADEGLGGFTHAQGLLDEAFQVGSCGVETKETPNLPLESKVMFGHVRKATSNIDELNAHPFVFNHFLWMHNGMLSDFDSYKNILLRRLRPAVRGMIQGSVDSEVAGALFCNNLEGFPNRVDYSMAEMRGAMRTMIAELRAFAAESALNICHHEEEEEDARGGGEEGGFVQKEEEGLPAGVSSSDISWSPSSMNFAVTDGTGLVVTRFRSKDNEDPPSLYYQLGVDKRYVSEKDGKTEKVSDKVEAPDWSAASTYFQTDGLVVASEPLEEQGPHLSSWRLLGKDKMISFHPDEGVKIECLSHKCTPDTPVLPIVQQ